MNEKQNLFGLEEKIIPEKLTPSQQAFLITLFGLSAEVMRHSQRTKSSKLKFEEQGGLLYAQHIHNKASTDTEHQFLTPQIKALMMMFPKSFMQGYLKHRRTTLKVPTNTPAFWQQREHFPERDQNETFFTFHAEILRLLQKEENLKPLWLKIQTYLRHHTSINLQYHTEREVSHILSQLYGPEVFTGNLRAHAKWHNTQPFQLELWFSLNDQELPINVTNAKIIIKNSELSKGLYDPTTGLRFTPEQERNVLDHPEHQQHSRIILQNLMTLAVLSRVKTHYTKHITPLSQGGYLELPLTRPRAAERKPSGE